MKPTPISATTPCRLDLSDPKAARNTARRYRTIASDDRCPHIKLAGPPCDVKISVFMVMDSLCHGNLEICDKGGGDWVWIVAFDDRAAGIPIPLTVDMKSYDPRALRIGIDSKLRFRDGVGRADTGERPMWILPLYAKRKIPSCSPISFRMLYALTHSNERVPLEATIHVGIEGQMDGRLHTQTAMIGVTMPESAVSVKTVVEIDLVAYSDTARLLEENLGANAVLQLNEEVQAIVASALKSVGVESSDSVVATTGDGAILMFDSPVHAHRFAEALHGYARSKNEKVKEASAKRLFRVGAATGEVVMRRRGEGAWDSAGIAIANAVRLEASCQPGGMLIDSITYTGLPLDLRNQYKGPITVRGKRKEQFEAWQLQVDVVESVEKPEQQIAQRNEDVDRGEFEESFALLDFVDQMELLCGVDGGLLRLMMALGMKASDRPSATLTCGERCSLIYEWVTARHRVGQLRVLVQKLLIKYGL